MASGLCLVMKVLVGILVDLGLMPNATQIAVCMGDVDLTPCPHQSMVARVTKGLVVHQCKNADAPSST